MRYAPDEFTIGIGGVIDRLGQLEGPRGPRTTKWMVAHITGLIDRHGFPPPIPSGNSTAPHARSRWLTHAVEHWLGSFMPPGASAAAERAAERQAGDELDAAAAAIAQRYGNPGLRVVEGGRA